MVVNRLEDLGVPTICRLNGGVYGGSTDLALACDFRIGVDTAEMFMPAARLGLHYYKSGIQRYVSRLGVDNAKMLFLTAQKITAPEMLRIGYLTAMVPAEALDEEVDKLATTLAANAPVAMRGMKRAINEFARGKLDEASRRSPPPRKHARRRDQGRHQGIRGEAPAEILGGHCENNAPCRSSASPVRRGRAQELKRAWFAWRGSVDSGIARKRLVAFAIHGIERDAPFGSRHECPSRSACPAPTHAYTPALWRKTRCGQGQRAFLLALAPSCRPGAEVANITSSECTCREPAQSSSNT